MVPASYMMSRQQCKDCPLLQRHAQKGKQPSVIQFLSIESVKPIKIHQQMAFQYNDTHTVISFQKLFSTCSQIQMMWTP